MNRYTVCVPGLMTYIARGIHANSPDEAIEAVVQPPELCSVCAEHYDFSQDDLRWDCADAEQDDP